MPISRVFRIPFEINGRKIERICNVFRSIDSDVILQKESLSRPVNGKNLIGVMSLNLQQWNNVLITIDIENQSVMDKLINKLKLVDF